MTRGDLLALADRVEALDHSSNAVDVLVEVALFEPDHFHVSARANAAGSKVIFTTASGKQETHWAWDWTLTRPETAAALRARALDTPAA